VKRVCTVGWALVGLVVAAMIAQGKFSADELSDPEHAFGFACRHLLFSGGLGLLIASILAANMSTCSAFMVDSGALFTQGFYRKYVSAGRPDRHYLWVGRTSGLVITLVGVFYAVFLIDQVLYSFLLTETMATYMGISILGGMIWWRANRWGALASLIIAMSTNFLLYHARGDRLDHWDANVFLAALAAGTFAMILVSLLTSPEPREQVGDFFDRLQTSSDQDLALESEGTERQDEAAVRPLLLVNLLQLRRAARGASFLQTYGEDLAGFLVGLALCSLLVLGTWVFFQL
jgi:Na+/proline symporter